VKYLGVAINPWLGPRPSDIMDRIESLGAEIAKAKLKPSQRVDILATYAIPRLLYDVTFGAPSLTQLKKADLAIGRMTKLWLHLVPNTTTGLLYSRWKDGGLAIPSLYRMGACGRAKRIFRLYHSEDPAVRGMARAIFSSSAYGKLWVAGGAIVRRWRKFAWI